MSDQIKQDQLYEDLSLILVLIKKLFKNLFLQISTKEASKQVANQQSIIITRCNQLSFKYKKMVIKRAQNLSTLSRFMSRVKDILRQIGTLIPRQKVQVMIIFKKIELITVRQVNKDSSASLITSLLEIIGSCNLTFFHSLKIKIAPMRDPSKYANRHTQGKEQKISPVQHGESKIRLKQNKSLISMKTEIPPKKDDLMTKNLQLYSVMEIDKEFYRERYFDLKNQENTSIFEEVMFRNRYIKNVMVSYDREFSKPTARKGSSKSTRKLWSKLSQQNQPNPLNRSQPSNLFNRIGQDKLSNADALRNVSSKSNLTISHTTMEESVEMRIESYRSIYQQKLLKCRNKKTVKMANTVIDLQNAIANSTMKEVSRQRWNFYKKSQEHLKFRYKYSQNKNEASLTKYGTINPEIFYNTISHKL